MGVGQGRPGVGKGGKGGGGEEGAGGWGGGGGAFLRGGGEGWNLHRKIWRRGCSRRDRQLPEPGGGSRESGGGLQG